MVEVEDILNPCPFCENDYAYLIPVEEPKRGYITEKGVAIKCDYCGTKGPLKDNLAYAIDAWNSLPRRKEDATADTEEGRVEE